MACEDAIPGLSSIGWAGSELADAWVCSGWLFPGAEGEGAVDEGACGSWNGACCEVTEGVTACCVTWLWFPVETEADVASSDVTYCG